MTRTRRRRLPAGVRVHSLLGIGLRSLRARPARSALTAGAIVLGVGMVFGVLVLVGTIHSTFGQMMDSIYGRTDLVISGEHSQGGLPTGTIIRVRATPGVRAASGTVSSVFQIVGVGGRVDRSNAAKLVAEGIDFSQPNTTDSRLVQGRDPIAGRGEIELDQAWAGVHHVRVGDRIRLTTPTGVDRFRVAGLFELGGGLDLGGYGIATLPLADARRITDRPAGWDQISVIARPGANVSDLQRRLARELGAGIQVTTPQTERRQALEQLSSLDVILYFFGGIALFTGVFLILNSFSMTVAQRMREIGTLRALGAGRTRVAGSILAEGLILASVSSVIGLALGAGLAVVLVRAMQNFGMPVSSVHFSAGAAVAAVVTGFVATCAGAAWPATRAGRVSPVRALIGATTPTRRLRSRRAVAGLVLFVPATAGGGLLWFGSSSSGSLVQIGATLTTMAMFLGMVLLAPFVILPVIGVLARPLRRLMPAEGRLAADATQANPARTSATASTLLITLAVVVVNATVASSFVGSIKHEIDATYTRDLTVQPIGYQEMGPPQAGLSAKLRRQIAALPQTGATASRRVLAVNRLPGGGAPGVIVGYDPYAYRRVDRIDYQGAPVGAVLRGLARGGIVVSAIYARAHDLKVGGRLRLQGPGATRDAPVVGLADTLDAGGQEIQVSEATIADIYGVRSDAQLAVRARSPGERLALTRAVRALLDRSYPGVEAQSLAEYKNSATQAINQQFGFFNAIVGVAVLVGVLGIINTLGMSVLERTREIGVLRALGASRWRIRRTMLNESLLISLAGAFAGAVVGLGIAVIWVLSMRETSYPGMRLTLPAGTLIGMLVAGVVIGGLASVLPARRAARLDPLAALRYE